MENNKKNFRNSELNYRLKVITKEVIDTKINSEVKTRSDLLMKLQKETNNKTRISLLENSLVSISKSFQYRFELDYFLKLKSKDNNNNLVSLKNLENILLSREALQKFGKELMGKNFKNLRYFSPMKHNTEVNIYLRDEIRNISFKLLNQK